MIGALRRRRLLWPSLIMVPTLVVLVVLGNWQWERLHWKLALLQDLQAAAKAEPIVMRVVPGSSAGLSDADLTALQFRRITVKGVFEHDKEMHVWSPAVGGPTWSVVTPFRLEQAAAARAGLAKQQASHLLVIRGVVPGAEKDPAKRQLGQSEGEREITGRIRLDLPNEWANEPNISKNEWFSRDQKRMAAHLDRLSSSKLSVAPFFLEAERSSGEPGAPQPQLQALNLSNRHLEYALTWWGLAVTLVGVYLAYIWSRLKD